MRFVRSDEGGFSKVLSRDEVGPDEPRALFLGRLWALFGPAIEIDDGFSYAISDRESGISFSAYSGASGPSYGAAVTREALEPVVRALEAVLAETAPADCALDTSVDIDYGGGRVRIGVRDGEPFEERKKERGRSPRGAKSYEDCVAIAKKRGGAYGIEAGWQLCIDQVLPEVPEEIEIDGRVYENCIGFGFSEKKRPVYVFDEGGGIEEIAVAAIPWGKPLPKVVGLWLESYERWRKGRRR